ncbi:hypothetical protein Tco_0648774 [Tanacetum coccineum]
MDLKQSEVTEAKSSIEEPPELELKDLPSHLEYAFLEGNDKLPGHLLGKSPTSRMILIFFILVPIKSFDGVCMGKKLLRSSKLAMKDPPGAIIVPISPPKLYECRLALPTDIRDANMGRHNDQIDWWMTVKRQGKFHNEMRCFKTQSKFVKSDDLSILLVPFSIFRGNKYILVAVDYLRNGLNSKGLPTK